MASTQKLVVELELKCNAEKYWESIKGAGTLFPKLFPDKYESIELLEGDGFSVGSIAIVRRRPGHPILSTTEKIEVLDEEKKTVIYTVIGGDLLKYFDNFKIHIIATPKGERTLVKWIYEFTKANEEVDSPDDAIFFALKASRDLEAYLLNA